MCVNCINPTRANDTSGLCDECKQNGVVLRSIELSGFDDADIYQSCDPDETEDAMYAAFLALG